MKRCLSALLAMLLLVLPCTTVLAAEDSLNLVVSDAVAAAGETVEVTVDVTENVGFSFLSFRVVYDTEALTLNGATSGFPILFEQNAGKYVWAYSGNYTAKGTILTLSFTVKEGTVSGEYPITIKVLEAYDYDEADIATETVGGTLIVPCTHDNVIHVDAIQSACHYNGNIEYWYCPDCETYWQDEALTRITNAKNIISPELGGNVVHVEAKNATCYENGNIEHWYCEECGQVWQDETRTQLTNHKNVIVPASHTLLVHMDAIAPDCHYEGSIEHWICYACETVWADEALTQVTNIKNVTIPELGGEVVHVEAVEPACGVNGNIEHWYCENCGQVWQDEALTQLTNRMNVIVPATEHTIVHVDAVEPGCHYNGNIEHWYCTDCETVWADEALTQITNHKSVILPATGEGLLVHMDAVEPGCHYEGNIEHWICYSCNQVWADEALTQVTNIKNVTIPELGGEVVHVEAVAPNCYENGNIEHWYCEECGQVWQDEALTQLTNHKNVIVPASHTLLVHMDAVEPGCHYEGNIEHWICYACETVWADEALTQVTNIKNVTVPELDGEVVHVDAVAPNCHENGNIEYWYCEECGQVWQDEARTQLTNHKNVIVPVTEHTIVHVDAVAPGCHMDGNIEHWYCTDCETVWSDEALTQITNHKSVILPATGEGNLVHMDAVEPGCHYNGNIEYWICYTCNQVWQNEELTQLTNIKNVIVPALGGEVIHVEAVAPNCYENGNIEHWYCEDCGQVWQNEALTQLTNHKNVIVPVAHSLLVHMDAVEPGCHYEGNIEHWICYACETVWADDALTQVTNIKNVVLPELGGDVTHVEAVAPGCYENGNIEHWYCEDCGQVWADEARTQLTNRMNVIVPAEHTLLVHMDAVEPGCHYEGNIEHWICYACETVWADEALTQITNVKNVIIPELGGDVTHVEAVAPGCYENGNIEYWYCDDCGQVWADETRTQLTNRMNVIVPATHTLLVHMDAVEPGCHYEGNIEHWICYACETVWADEALTQITNVKNVIIPELGGNVVHVEAKNPTYKKNGNIEYWYCTNCDQVWADEARTQLTNRMNVIVPMLVQEDFADGLEWTGDTDSTTDYVGNLTDGQIETEGKYDKNLWYGADIRKEDDGIFTLIVDLGELKEIGQTNLHTWPAGYSGIIIPGSIDFYVSEDGETYTLIGSVTEFDGTAPQWVGIVLEQALTARYVRIDMVGRAEGTSGSFWFASEVEVLEHVEHVHDLVHIDAVAPGCHYEGNIEYWYCLDCGTVWADKALTQVTNHKSVILPALGGDVTHVDAVAPGCYENGNIEHWYCEDCGQVWQDEALTQLTNHKNVIVPAAHTLLVHMDAVEPGCHYEGNIEHWICYACETVWADEALTQITNIKSVVLPELGGDVTHVEAVAPGCYENGNIEYWYCEDCGQVWADEARTQLTNRMNVIVPAAHTLLVHMDAVEPGCHYEGNTEYWICYGCETVWADENLTQITNIKNVVLPELGGDVTHVDAVAPGCYENGNIEYWYCEDCGQVWADEARTQLTNRMNVIVPAEHTLLVHMDAVAPGCHFTGNIEHWICYACETVWADEALTQVTNIKNVVLPELGGDVIHVGAKNPTATENGNIEHWYCEDCGQVWADEARTQLTNHMNVVIPATGIELGDVDGDGKINAKDYMKLKKHILGKYNFENDDVTVEEALANSDIDGNGKVNAKDYMMLKKMVLGTWSPKK